MKARELKDRIKRAAKKKGVYFRYNPKGGKGSHGRIYFDDKKTTIKGLNKEIGEGLLNDMLKQLGLTREDIK